MAYNRRLLEGDAQGERAAWARYRLARAYHARGSHDEEHQWYKQQMEADPKCNLSVTFRAYLAVGECYEEQGDLDHARERWRAVLPFASEHWSLQLHEKIAHSYFMEERYTEAIEATEAQLAYAETLPPEGDPWLHPVRPWLRIAESHQQLGQETEALQAYERIIARGEKMLPEHWTAVGRAARIYDERGDEAKAQQYYRAFVDNYAWGAPEQNPPWGWPDRDLFEWALIGLAQIGLDRADPSDSKPYGQRDIDRVYQLLVRFRPVLSTGKARAAAEQLIQEFRQHPLKPTLDIYPPPALPEAASRDMNR
jgi:tetratricopeptide (TPR) repeat protein